MCNYLLITRDIISGCCYKVYIKDKESVCHELHTKKEHVFIWINLLKYYTSNHMKNKHFNGENMTRYEHWSLSTQMHLFPKKRLSNITMFLTQNSAEYPPFRY